MPRIRTIKPEFPQSESMGKVSREARLFFILLWTLCDDEGRTRASSRMLASLLYPYDEDSGSLIDGWVRELEGQDCVVRYEAAGSTYLEVRNWSKHQRIDKPSKSRIPPFDEASRRLPEDSQRPREDSTLDQRNGMEGTKERIKGLRSRDEVSRPDDVPEELWRDFLTHRKARRAPITETALAGFRREAAKAGITLEAAIRTAIERNWSAFKADWAKDRTTTAPKASSGEPDWNNIHYGKSRKI